MIFGYAILSTIFFMKRTAKAFIPSDNGTSKNPFDSKCVCIVHCNCRGGIQKRAMCNGAGGSKKHKIIPISILELGKPMGGLNF